MKRTLLAATLLAALAGPALPQGQNPADHQEHHPTGHARTSEAQQAPLRRATAQPQGQTQAPMAQMMQNMPEECRTHMQTMPESCRGRMQQMMQGGGMRGGMMGGMGGASGGGSRSVNAPEATKDYLDAMSRMHEPMTQGVQDTDPDVAFVKGMIPHHQGAIDMARVALQYGKDEQTKKWANDVIRDQEREIAEMQEWLKKRGQ